MSSKAISYLAHVANVCGFTNAEAMPSKKDKITFDGCEPSMLFREFAAECMELAQTASSPEKRALYMKMANVWFQMAVRWENPRQSK
jgi:hypothetical protein